jgi:Uma2 family endonuclease
MRKLRAMAPPPKKPATYEDLFALPENVVGEIIQGELIVSPRPAFAHAHAASALGADIGTPFFRGKGGPGGWWILDEIELHFDNDILVPDLAGWRRERLPKPPSPREPFMTLAPDWVCEVLSPSTARVDRRLKLPVYARAQVANVWFIDPMLRTLEVLRRQREGWLLVGTFSDREQVRAEPFDAVELDLGGLWLQDDAPTIGSTG